MNKNQIIAAIRSAQSVRGFKMVDSDRHHGGKANTFRNGFALSISKVTVKN